jgi:hypothetical protein
MVKKIRFVEGDMDLDLESDYPLESKLNYFNSFAAVTSKASYATKLPV